ncbi:MAG: DUF1425 domain-containing protein [Phycisphaerae bacterium]
MKVIALTLAAATLALAGLTSCTEPISAQQDPIVAYPQVHMASHWLETWTRVQPPIVNAVGSGQLQVAIPIRNLTNDPLSIDYQYRFLNKGAEVEGRSGWHNYVIPPRGMGQITFTSMTHTANDFDVEIRYRK